MSLELKDVYSGGIGSKQFLYHLLGERREEQNISHRKMPTFAEHCAFVDSRPYQHWYVIHAGEMPVGAIYMKEYMGQIGVHMWRPAYDGMRVKAIRELMRLHPRPRYVANVSVNDKSLRADIENLGFKHIQETFELIP